MFCLNCLPSVGEKRLVTLNVEASNSDLVSVHFFNPYSGLENVLWKHTVIHELVRSHCQASDLHCITFNWRPRHDKLKTYCKSVPELLIWALFDFIEKRFEMASRRIDSVVKGSISHQTCSAWIFYHLCVKRHLCHWMLRPQTTT